MARVRQLVLAGLMALAAATGPTRAETLPGWLTGVALADGAFNSKGTRLNFDYTYPTAKQVDYFVAKGFRTFRVPLIVRRVLPENESGRESVDWRIIMALVQHAALSNSQVIIDLHQFGGMPAGLVGRDGVATEQFVSFWHIIAERLKAQPNVIFGLMNEPNKQSASEWLSAANAAILAIRHAGAKQLILVPGSYWDGAGNWTHTDNATVMLGVEDPERNFAYEVHQYLDADSSGTSKDVVPGSGATRLAAFTSWARAHRARGFLGEFGFAATPEAMKEGADLLAHMKTNRDVWLGWTYWAAGAWWGTYMFSVEPNKDGTDKPQMAVLERWK